jgi:multiple sugar transport system permease protein
MGLKVLLLVGGSHHDSPEIRSSLEDIFCDGGAHEVTQSEDLAILNTEALEPFNVIVNATTDRLPEPSEHYALLNAVASGRGLVVVHGGLASFWNSQAYFGMVGSKFAGKSLDERGAGDFWVKLGPGRSTLGHPITLGTAQANVSRLSRSQSNRVGNLLSHILLATGSIVFAGPFIWMLMSSLKTQYEIYNFPPTLLPESVQWMNYVVVFRDQPFARFIGNSMFVSLCVTFGVIMTSSLAGYSFARLRFPGRDRIFLLYLGTMMIPGAVLLIPSYALMIELGWRDSYYALIVPGLVSAWGTFLMRQFMLNIPKELEDAAYIDGASRLRIYWTVIMPVSKPVIATLAIFTFMGVWNELLWPVIILRTPEMYTLPMGLARFQSRFPNQTPWHLVMAASTISVLPILILFMAGQKYYVQGIVTTGLKG